MSEFFSLMEIHTGSIKFMQPFYSVEEDIHYLESKDLMTNQVFGLFVFFLISFFALFSLLQIQNSLQEALFSRIYL